MNTKRWVVLLGLVSSTAVGAFAADSITGSILGTDGPPGMLGGYAMQPAQSIPGAQDDPVSDVPFPGGRMVSVVPTLALERIGAGWATWSNTYAGDVYWRDVFFDNIPGIPDLVTLTLPLNTRAFYLYVAPNYFGPPPTAQEPAPTFLFDLAASNGIDTISLADQVISGYLGASGFGFYAGPAAPDLTTITVSGWETWPDGFGLGQMGVNRIGGQEVPDGTATLGLLGFAALALAFLRRTSSR